MRINGPLDNYRVRITRLICACCLISLAMCSYAQVASQGTFIGRQFWYEPSHDKYVPTEFYDSPVLDSPKTLISKKTRIQVVAAQKGWFAIRVGPDPASPVKYMPIRMFMFRLYQAGAVSDPYAAKNAFMRASLFEADPDIVKKQFESKDEDPTLAATPKPSAKLKPWQKYKENWGSVTPAPKKNKNLLLDPIKPPEQPEQPDSPP
jgi:hypothetical protein